MLSRLAARAAGRPLLRSVDSICSPVLFSRAASLRPSAAQRAADSLLFCVAVSKCEKYDLQTAAKVLASRSVPAEILEGAVHARVGASDVFVLANGSVVAWGKDERQAVDALPLLRGAELGDQLELESEDMDFRVVDKDSGLADDLLEITAGPTRTVDMLAFSNAMAKHTKLSSMEVKAEQLLLSVKHISNAMAAGHKPKLKAHEVDVLTGKLLQLRGLLNLYSEITEVPDLYWSHPEQERLYELLSDHLDIPKRSDILNKKLDYAANTLGVLRSHLSEVLSVRLEWMVIVLIMVEVAIEVKNILL